MKVILSFGGPLRDVAGGADEVLCELGSGTKDAILNAMNEISPALIDIVFAPSGDTRRYVSIYHNGVGLQPGDFPAIVEDGDTLRMTLLVSGG